MDPSHLRTSATRPEPVPAPAEADTFPNPTLPTRRCRHIDAAAVFSSNPDPRDDALAIATVRLGEPPMLRLHAPAQSMLGSFGR
jgi:hypothetical protein